MEKNGFTLIELIVTIAIIAVLSAIIMFSVSQYINKGKDSNVQGNLAVLIPAGESYYNVEDAENSDGYTGFCATDVVKNSWGQMSFPSVNLDCPTSTGPEKIPGLCCNATQDTWAACAQLFTDNTEAFCVDSRGIKKTICNSSCANTITITQCPDDDLSTCQ